VGRGRDAVAATPDGAEERHLLARARAGDRSAAEALVERTYGGVYAALHRMTGGKEDLAADLTQETYRKAWEALDRFDGRSSLSTWLFRIAYNTFLNHVRGPRRVVPLDEEKAAAVPADDPDPSEIAAARQDAERLRTAVLALPEELRVVVTALFWGELPVADVARQEGITGVAIRKRLRRALAILGEGVARGTRGGPG
jgi:RNA polymerase sigma-70 factor (ECF subfamily)